MKKKRLLVVSQHFWPEGFRINDIVEGFIDEDIEVDILCGLPNYPQGEWFPGYRYTGPRREEYKGAQVFRSGEIRRKGNTSLRIFLNYVSFPLFAAFHLFRLAGRQYDAVFCYETSPVLMIFPAILLAKLRRIPLTTYVLDLWPDNLYSVLPVKNRVLRRIAQAVSDWHYKRCDRLIALSEAQAGHLAQVTGCAKRPPAIEIVPQYCEDFYAEDVFDAELSGKYAKYFTILFAGNISPAQDLENLVRAMKRIHDLGQRSVRCLIVGDGMSKDALEKTIQEAGLSDVFLFCGRQKAQDIPKWTGAASALYAGLAKSENLGMTVPAKIASYLAAGRPLLVAADGEAARTARESGAALVSEAGDDEALANHILQLVKMPAEERAGMGRQGRNYYHENFRRAPLLAKLRHIILQ